MGRQLTEAIPVDGVATRHLVRGAAGAEEIFLADGAVTAVLSGLTIVGVVEILVDAHAASVAVLKVVGSAYTAETTVMTVEGLLLVVHPEVANVAVVASELDSAGDTVVARRDVSDVDSVVCVSRSQTRTFCCFDG